MGNSAPTAVDTATESAAEAAPAPPFVLPDIPYKRMVDAKKVENPTAFDTIVSAMEMGFGVTKEEVIKVFDTRLLADKTKSEIASFEKELTGISVGKAIVTRMVAGTKIAKDGGGSVSFSLVLADDGESAKLVPRFSGIAGASSGGGSTGRRNTRYSYADNGVEITVPLKKYILNTYPDSHAGKRIAAHASGAKKGNVSSWVAVEEGMEKHGDTFVITRTEKKDDSSD